MAILKRLGPKGLAMLGLGGSGIGTAISAVLWIATLAPAAFRGLGKLRGTELGEKILGKSDKKKIAIIQALMEKRQDKEDLAGTLQDQMLQRRESQREALAAAPTGLSEALLARSAGRVAKGLREGGGLLTPDEREEARSVVIQAGLPNETEGVE